MTRRGFTLIEVLLAMVVGSGLLLAVFAALNSGSDGLARMSGKTNQRVEGREALTQLRRDFVNYQYGSTLLERKFNGGWPADRVSFLARIPLQDQDSAAPLGSLCQVTYELVLTPPNSATGEGARQDLVRRIVPSDQVLPALLESGEFADFPTSASGGAAAIAFNVLGFDVELLEEKDGSLGTWSEASEGEPLQARVKVFVVDGALSKRLETSSDWQKDVTPLGTLADAEDHKLKGVDFYEMTISLK